MILERLGTEIIASMHLYLIVTFYLVGALVGGGLESEVDGVEEDEGYEGGGFG